jgi:uncharacterized protein (TIGR02271 family)
MARLSLDQVRSWFGRTAVDSGGAPIGTIADVYLSRDTEQPVWALVDVGQFGAATRLVPVAAATDAGDHVSVPHPRAIVVAAPDVHPGEALSDEDERALSRHYGLERPDSEHGDSEHGDSERPADEAATGGGEPRAAELVRSEEELRVGTHRRPGRTVRMRKEVVTDYVTKTIPVRREQLRLVEEPVADEDRERARQQEQSPEEQAQLAELTLHEEQPVVGKRVVPTERVRVGTRPVAAEAEVSDQVRKERVEATKDDPAGRRDGGEAGG